MPEVSYQHLNPPARILLGPGPSNVHPRVQAAMTAPMVGHLDPYFITIMEDSMTLLRYLFRTRNKLTFPLSGTGSAGMEAAFDNFLEPGDTCIVCTCGAFGDRMVDNAQRTGANVIQINAEWGRVIEPEQVEAVLKSQKKVKLLAIVHAETSTGALQPLEAISKLCKQYDTLFVVDTVTSLAGHEVAVDDWGIDICYSGTQKCISCPPGLSPLTVNEKALSVLQSRKKKVPSWYLDLSMISAYWSSTRFYHHTAPITMIYGFHEALALIAEEGLEARVKRHLKNGAALHAGLEAMGLKLHAQEGHRLCSLTTVRIPEGIDDAKVRAGLLNENSLEIGGGLGTLRGKIWRIGLMGHSSTPENVLLCLSALEKQMSLQGYETKAGAGVVAASEILKKK